MKIQNRDLITQENFSLYAAKHYNNVNCLDMEGFQEDLARFKYISKLFKKYKEKGDIKENLILNHIIILTNLFGPQNTVRMCFLKMIEYKEYLKPFFIFLNIMPEKIEYIFDENFILYSSDISMDLEIVKKLREIRNDTHK